MQTDSVTSLLGGARAYGAHSGPNAILKTLADCTSEEWHHGRTWYRLAHRFCKKVAALTGKDPDTVAAVIARLSPRVSWADNKIAALEICGNGAGNAAGRCYPDNVIRAEEIAAANDSATIAAQVLPMKGYKRPKISAFYRNITEPNCPQSVTVDSWAARIWIGDCEAPTLRITAKESVRIQRDYIAAATLCDLLPQELQAITWIGAHRIRKESGQRNLFDIGLQFKI
jgi:hypothetical protein